MINNTTIAAVATPAGGALTIIRVSGSDSIAICDRLFVSPKTKNLTTQKGYTVHFGELHYNGEVIDQVLVTLFRAPYSYTGENMVEISCHGSAYISKRIMEALSSGGVVPAAAGEFTMRAFLNGKMDLSQAEAVADVIAADSKAAHDVAINQIRGGYSSEFVGLRADLLKIASLLELELDFSEEDVEFADRSVLSDILAKLKKKIGALKESFYDGNVIKNGVPVAIVGSPNVGKSTLLNRLLNDDRAMVSDIAGTTRDVIEEVLTISGVQFRLIDTAGLRDSDDVLENMGIERSLAKISQASVVLLIVDCRDEIDAIVDQYNSLDITDVQRVAVVFNKCDYLTNNEVESCRIRLESALGGSVAVIFLSAKFDINISLLKDFLVCDYVGINFSESLIVTNSRHYGYLCSAYESLISSEHALLSGFSSDLIAEDIRHILYNLGNITGEITTDEILGNIFSKFCIGK